MRVLLGWLADFSWVLYAACALGAVVYVARAITLQQRLRGSLTTFERDTTSVRVLRLWRTAVTFVLVGAALFSGQTFLLPRVIPEELIPPTPTRTAGLETPIPSPSPTAVPIVGTLPTVVPTAPAVTPPPSPEPTPSPTPTPSAPTPAYPLSAQFGNVAELVGYDLISTEVNTGQAVELILYWRALEGAGAANYVVFAHLLPPDISRIIAQHDGQPVEGTRPTSSWVAGETLTDFHSLTFLEADYAGTGQIAIGLYIPGGDRVPVASGGDYILLPTAITVVAP